MSDPDAEPMVLDHTRGRTEKDARIFNSPVMESNNSWLTKWIANLRDVQPFLFDFLIMNFIDIRNRQLISKMS